MFRKFFIFLFLVLSVVPFKASATSCTYTKYAMSCGGIAGNECASNERCLPDSANPIPNPGGTIGGYGGKCVVVADMPCDQPKLSGRCDVSNPASCEDPTNFVCRDIMIVYFADDDSLSAVACNPIGRTYGCLSYDTINAGVETAYPTCVKKETPPTQTGACVSTLTEWRLTDNLTPVGCFIKGNATPILDYGIGCDLKAQKDALSGISYTNVCMSDSNQTNFPNFCNKGEVCSIKKGFWGENSICAPGKDAHNISVGLSCCSENSEGSPIDTGDCGKNLIKPISGVNALYYDCCDPDSYCVGTNLGTGNTAIFAGKGPNMPDAGKCKECVGDPTQPLDGLACEDTLHGKGNDDCCNENYQCMDISGSKKCVKISDAPVATCDGSAGKFLTPGEICAPKDLIGITGYDKCDTLCPVGVLDGPTDYVKWTTDSIGNHICARWGNNTNSECNSASGTCGCPSGNICQAGECVDSSNCNNSSVDCDNAKPCCDTAATCVGNAGAKKCKNNTCAQVIAKTLTCVGHESCCTGGSTCDPSSTHCVNSIECTGTSTSCCGYGKKCDGAGSCLASNDTACSPLSPPGEKAPGYKGPIFDIPTLFKAISSILFPAAIGIGLFFVVKSGYQIMTSEGDQQSLKNAQEGLTSAVIGILFIILSSSILRVIINSLLD